MGNFGIAHTKQNKYNELKYLSGFNWYVSCNNNLQLCGSPIIATAPAYTLPLAVPNFSVQITDNGISLFRTLSILSVTMRLSVTQLQ